MMATFPDDIWDGNDVQNHEVLVAELIATQQVVKNLMENGFHVKVGSFICPEDVGVYQVTGVGFRPKRVAFYASWIPQPSTYYYCSGMMDEFGNQNSMSWAGRGNRTGDSSVDKVIYLRGLTATLIEASYMSMDNDGFTIDFSFSDPRFLVRWEAIG